MLYRNKKNNDPNGGKYIGIGGKLKDNETPVECLKREFFEETGLTLLNYKLRGIITFLSKKWETEIMYLFTCDAYSGSEIECNEGDLLWVSRQDVLSLNLWEGDKIFLCDILNSRDSFKFYRLCYDENDNLIAGGEE